jgi:hypothetical protein
LYLLLEEVIQRRVVREVTIFACLAQSLAFCAAVGAQSLELGSKLFVAIGRDE